MIAVNDESKMVLDKLTEGIEKIHEKRVIDNNEKDSGFMSVTVEKISADIFSVAHFKKLGNGVQIRDPEMFFLKDEEGLYYPAMFQMDAPPLYQESIRFVDDGKKEVDAQLQEEHAEFADMWMKNICWQQNIDIES